MAITGHQRLSGASHWAWVRMELERIVVRSRAPICAISSLAIGADQLFAEIVLATGGMLQVIVPFPDYATVFEDDGRAAYERFLALATAVECLPQVGAREDCYLRAGRAAVDRADVVVAVWDGAPAAGRGGTADIVAYARERGKPILQVDPVARALADLEPRRGGRE